MSDEPLILTVENHSAILAKITEILASIDESISLLQDGAAIYEAHTENLIERVRALEIFTDYDTAAEDNYIRDAGHGV